MRMRRTHDTIASALNVLFPLFCHGWAVRGSESRKKTDAYDRVHLGQTPGARAMIGFEGIGVHTVRRIIDAGALDDGAIRAHQGHPNAASGMWKIGMFSGFRGRHVASRLVSGRAIPWIAALMSASRFARQHRTSA